MSLPSAHELTTHYATLESTYRALYTRLHTLADGLCAPGILPAEQSLSAIVSEIGRLRGDTDALRDRLFALGDELQARLEYPSSAKTSTPLSLQDLATLLVPITEALERQESATVKLIERAVTVLGDVLYLAHRDRLDFPPLTACQDKARALLAVLQSLDPSTDQTKAHRLAESHVVFAQLLDLNAHANDLDDYQAEELRAIVAAAFAPELSAAAMRGKLVVTESDVSNPHVVQKSPKAHRLRSGSNGLTASPYESLASDGSSMMPWIADAADAGSVASLSDPEILSLTQAARPINRINAVPQTEPQVEPLTEPQVEPVKAETKVVSLDETVPYATIVEATGQVHEPDEPTEHDEHAAAFDPTHPEESTRDLARAIINGTTADRSNGLLTLTWRLVEQEHFGLAYYLARYHEERYPDAAPHLPSWLIHAITLAPHVRYDVKGYDIGGISDLLKADFEAFSDGLFVNGRTEWNNAIRYLLLSAALRPALLAPHAGASAILQLPHMQDSFMAAYCAPIAAYSDRAPALNPNALKQVQNHAAWQAKLAALQHNVDIWLTHAPQMKINYAPATAAWQQLVRPDGLIRGLLAPVLSNDLSRLEQVRQETLRLSRDDAVREEVNRASRASGAHRVLIEARALRALLTHVREATSFAHAWLVLQETAGSPQRDFLLDQSRQLHDSVAALQDAVLADLDKVIASTPSLPIKAAASQARRAVLDIHTLFDPDRWITAEEPEARHILQADLLYLPTISLNGDWEPEANLEELTTAIIMLVADDHIDWGHAFADHCAARDHEATLRIIDYCERAGIEGISVEEWRLARQKQILDCQDALTRQLDETSKDVENALAFGLLGEIERADYAAVLDRIRQDVDRTQRFFARESEILGIREAIAERRDVEIARIRGRLESEIGTGHRDYTRIASVLDRGDVLTANEYIQAVRDGSLLPDESTPAHLFDAFFPDTARRIADYLDPEDAARKPDTRTIVDHVRRQRGSQLPISMNQVAGAQAAQAATMLSSWFNAKKRQRIETEEIRQILIGLGFSFNDPETSIVVDGASRRPWFSVVTDPIRDRTRCPVPAYGSAAKGYYRVLGVWGRPTEDEILNDVGDQHTSAPPIVFYFGTMTRQRRRHLAHLCRERQRTLIVLDDTLLLYLCGERGSRLPTFFECALPFTFLKPYVTTASLVPPEMFYGRARVRADIVDPMGTCYIFGGRQLGKTALLRDVQRAYHDLERDHVALWLDLNGHGIGTRRPIDEVWNLVAEELNRIPGFGLPAQESDARIKDGIVAWLDGHPQRHILLLLDEADTFLESDSKDRFNRTGSIKDLMDRSERRFKVVFAGLHNVQRTTTLENNPLAHYGEPRCIGPLLADNEWREARALIEHPMATLGYRFETPDLVTRILSQTNYYPSLIQLYCNELLEHLQSVNFDRRHTPPYVIQASHVDEAYQSQSLREAIRHRFALTLQLDKRYEVIAYVIALASLAEDRETFSVAWIRQQSLDFWSAGFTTSMSEDGFRVLLEEMNGLGLLRITGDGSYALRSPNVISLLGTERQILAKLSEQREPPIGYEASTFRSRTEDIGGVWRSAITAQQESVLRSRKNDVSLMLGCAAAGIAAIGVYLSAEFHDMYIPLEGLRTYDDLQRELTDLVGRAKEGTTVVLVSDTYNTWTEDWVDRTTAFLCTLTSRRAFFRIVFTANPRTIWNILGRATPAIGDMITAKALVLAPWDDAALRQWIQDDSGFADIDLSARQHIYDCTGNWSSLLRVFYAGATHDKGQWNKVLAAFPALLTEPGNARRYADEFGLEQLEARRVLSDLDTLGEASTEDLVAVVDGIAPTVVRHCLRWADLLRLISPTTDGYWRLNPAVARVLRALK